MNQSTARALPSTAAAVEIVEHTLDLAALAGIGQDDKVEIRAPTGRAVELFQRTLEFIEHNSVAPGDGTLERGLPGTDFLPQEEDLRARFKFAQALGSYAALNSLLDRYAPAYRLSIDVRSSELPKIPRRKIRMLEDYKNQIQEALEHASSYLSKNSTTGFTLGEVQELNEILIEAKDRFKSIETVLGMRLIHDVQRAVQELYTFHEKTQTVQRTVSGIFLVDSEVLFMPASNLIDIVETIFKAVGNPFVVEHIDGTVLLAARNLLIQAVSFYSYYGREQIYRVFEKGQGRGGRTQIARCIKDEIRTLFIACKTDNKLVLTRMMSNAEREFQMSVEAIQIEAAKSAMVAVERLMPVQARAPKPKPKGILQRLSRWLFHDAA